MSICKFHLQIQGHTAIYFLTKEAPFFFSCSRNLEFFSINYMNLDFVLDTQKLSYELNLYIKECCQKPHTKSKRSH